MKKTIISVFIITVTLFSITNCKSDSSDIAIEGVGFDSLVIDTVAHLTDDPSSPSCRISLHLCYAVGNNAEKINDSLMRCGILSPDYLSLSGMKLSTKQAADSFINRYIEDYRSFYAAIYRDDKTTEQADLAYILHTRVEMGRNGIICYYADIDNKMGSAETRYTIAKNILASTGHIMTLQDVFVPGAERKLKELIVEELCDMTDSDDEDELLDKGYFANGSVYASHNFVINDDGIEFIYIKGEIADRDKGEIVIRIGYSDLKKIMKKWN